jgi:hypothetical protein
VEGIRSTLARSKEKSLCAHLQPKSTVTLLFLGFVWLFSAFRVHEGFENFKQLNCLVTSQECYLTCGNYYSNFVGNFFATFVIGSSLPLVW